MDKKMIFRFYLRFLVILRHYWQVTGTLKSVPVVPDHVDETPVEDS